MNKRLPGRLSAQGRAAIRWDQPLHVPVVDARVVLVRPLSLVLNDMEDHLRAFAEARGETPTTYTRLLPADQREPRLHWLEREDQPQVDATKDLLSVFLHFVGLADADPQAIIAFAETWGALGTRVSLTPPWDDGAGPTFQLSEPVGSYYREARRARAIVRAALREFAGKPPERRDWVHLWGEPGPGQPKLPVDVHQNRMMRDTFELSPQMRLTSLAILASYWGVVAGARPHLEFDDTQHRFVKRTFLPGILPWHWDNEWWSWSQKDEETRGILRTRPSPVMNAVWLAVTELLTDLRSGVSRHKVCVCDQCGALYRKHHAPHRDAQALCPEHQKEHDDALNRARVNRHRARKRAAQDQG